MLWFYLALITSVLWGLCYSLMAHLGRQFPPEVIMLGMYMFGIPIYVSVVTYTKNWPLVQELFTGPHAYKLFVLTILFAIANITILTAFKLTNNPFLVSLVEMTYPVFVLLFGMLLFGMGQFTLISFASFVLIFAGVALLLYGQGHA